MFYTLAVFTLSPASFFWAMHGSFPPQPVPDDPNGMGISSGACGALQNHQRLLPSPLEWRVYHGKLRSSVVCPNKNGEKLMNSNKLQDISPRNAPTVCNQHVEKGLTISTSSSILYHMLKPLMNLHFWKVTVHY